MAEGWTRHLHGDRLDAHSAGIETHGLNPRAVKVMREAGVDIGQQVSKTVAELGTTRFDLVVTVCADADQQCPAFSGATKVVHRGFEDPPRLALKTQDEEQALDCFRKVRDEIRTYVENLPRELEQTGGCDL